MDPQTPSPSFPGILTFCVHFPVLSICPLYITTAIVPWLLTMRKKGMSVSSSSSTSILGSISASLLLFFFFTQQPTIHAYIFSPGNRDSCSSTSESKLLTYSLTNAWGVKPNNIEAYFGGPSYRNSYDKTDLSTKKNKFGFTSADVCDVEVTAVGR